MTTETTPTKQDEPAGKKSDYRTAASASAPVYGLGLLGAWFYYLSTATSFWDGVLGFLKGIFWPGVLVYELLKFLQL